MNTEKHYADGGEPHYQRVRRLKLSWCRANITKYAERTKGTEVADLIKVADYALMELEGEAVMSGVNRQKLAAVLVRLAALLAKHPDKGDFYDEMFVNPPGATPVKTLYGTGCTG